MRRAIEKFRKSLLDFIDQRDKMMLLVACPEAEAALINKILLDQQNSSRNDLYYLIADDFLSSDQYVDAIVSRMRREFEAAVEMGDGSIPPLPSGCEKSTKTTAATRLKECFGYARNLVDPSTGHRIVWCLSPGTIANLASFERLIMECVANDSIEPWMRGLRLFVRVPKTNMLARALASAPLVAVFPYAIPTNASEDELREDVSNPLLPLAERSTSLLQLGFIDMAHGRTDAAEIGLRESLSIAQQTNDLGMQALAMIGLGDTVRRPGDVRKAKYWYECAIVPAGEGKQIMSLAMISERLGAIAFEQARFEDAEFYYDQLTILKRCIPDENGLIDALLWRGRSQLALLRAEKAVASCQEAILLCKSFDITHREAECLSELNRSYQAMGKVALGERECSDWHLEPNLTEV